MTRTILDEVVSNAIFYNKPEGMVTIQGSATSQFLKLEVIDTGHGIRKEDLEKIYEQFYRSIDSASMNQAGAGLGLFMVKNLLKSYGGDISVQSTFGEGSKFTLTFLAQ